MTTTRKSGSFGSAPREQDRVEPDREAVFIKPDRKAVFVKPQLICYGAVIDLTNQFGGSLTPEEREAEGFQ